MLRVLFMQSQTYHGSCTVIQEQLMRYLDRSRVETHVAYNRAGDFEGEMSANRSICSIPGVSLRPTSFGPSILQKKPMQILSECVKGLDAIPSLAGLARYIRRRDISIIHGTEKPRDAVYGVLLGKLTGARSIVHLHVKWNTWLNPGVRWALRNADAVVAVSPFVAQSTVGSGIRPERVYTLMNSVVLQDWDDTLDGGPVRREYGIADTTTVVGILARLFPWKGHVELLRALALAKERVPDFKLLIVGEPDPRCTPGRRDFSIDLHELVAELGLERQVTFTGFRTDVPRVMAALDIFAMPSYEEPFGVVYLEAMAMRKPVIALANGGAVYPVRDGETGYLVPVGGIDTMADRLVTLMRDPELRARMGAKGRERVEQHFTAQRMSAQAEAIYRQVLNAHCERAVPVAFLSTE